MGEKALFFIKTHIPQRLFLLFRPLYHYCLSFAAAVYYRFPSRGLFVIGVTGTNGKTTVVELIDAVLRQNGAAVASVSSLRFRIGQEEKKNEFKMTMPGRFFLQKFLHDAKKSGCRFAVIEVTSEGIKQFRHRFINFRMAVLTNVTPEHIESHGGFEPYLRAKLDLFFRLAPDAVAVINSDDRYAGRFSAATTAHKIFYGKKKIITAEKEFSVHATETFGEGNFLEIDHNGIRSSLFGEFNVSNILAASAAGLALHVPLNIISDAVAGVKGIAGRMEFLQREPFIVVVDYAHTPDSLKRVYTFLSGNPKSKIQNPKLICVLGAAGGGRDKWKRPEFGKIASEFCSEIILTNEDPYDESPQTIIEAIERGLSLNSKSPTINYKKILDRREAIREAIKSAKAGDTVIITGKGAEPHLAGPHGEKIPWDDRQVVRAMFQKEDIEENR